jgi:hypothetical protein
MRHKFTFFRLHRFLLIVFIILSFFSFAQADDKANCRFDPGKASFSVKYKDEISPYTVNGVFLPPGEKLHLEPQAEVPGRVFRIEAAGGVSAAKAGRGWRLTFPGAAGLYPVRVYEPATAEEILFNVFVTVPAARVREGCLNGYRIGDYPEEPFFDRGIYRPPRGFIEVSAENMDTFVSPHFKLKQFVCKQADLSVFPQYMALQERLILKLELVLEKLNENGIRCNSLEVMSGYRTPAYNKLLGNVKYSLHVWGGAADIYIDENCKDGNMDDLNCDGEIDFKDAAVVYDLIDSFYGKPFYAGFVGGLARYRPTHHHPPFVHIDVRGRRARWGD